MEILTSVKRLYIIFKSLVNDFVYSFGRAALLLLVEVQNHTVPVRERGRIRVKKATSKFVLQNISSLLLGFGEKSLQLFDVVKQPVPKFVHEKNFLKIQTSFFSPSKLYVTTLRTERNCVMIYLTTKITNVVCRILVSFKTLCKNSMRMANSTETCWSYKTLY